MLLNFLKSFYNIIANMGGLIRKATIERHIITKEGHLDVHITLDLNLFINPKGEISVENEIPLKEKTKYEIPELDAGNEIIEFENEA